MAAQPITKKPNQVTPYPPSKYRIAHKVQTGQNWWTLQKQYNLPDVWDLIRFNFGTNQPAEINWCLKHLVGCTLMTADKKNYRFSSAATPGIIYVPTMTWDRGQAGGNTSPAPPPMDGNLPPPTESDGLCLEAVRIALKSPAVMRMDFDLPGTGRHFNSSSLRKVATHLAMPHDAHGRIEVRHNSDLGRGAKYFIGDNLMQLGFAGSGSYDDYALILHEWVHAAMDLENWEIQDRFAEAAAYVAQMIYLQYYPAAGYTKPPTSSDQQMRSIFYSAWWAAKTLQSGLIERSTLFPFHFQTLALSVALHPDYDDHAWKSSGYAEADPSKRE